jgi:hypothetical protein
VVASLGKWNTTQQDRDLFGTPGSEYDAPTHKSARHPFESHQEINGKFRGHVVGAILETPCNNIAKVFKHSAGHPKSYPLGFVLIAALINQGRIPPPETKARIESPKFVTLIMQAALLADILQLTGTKLKSSALTAGCGWFGDGSIPDPAPRALAPGIPRPSSSSIALVLAISVVEAVMTRAVEASRALTASCTLSPKGVSAPVPPDAVTTHHSL